MKPCDVGVDRDRLGHRAGAALGQRPDDVEDADEVEAADQDGDRHHRPDGGQHDLEEGAPVAGAIDLGRFGQRLVDIGERGEQDQEHERRPLPDLADENRGIDEVRIDRPQRHDLAAPEPADDLVDRPVALVEHQPPGGAGDNRRDDGRQHDERDEDLPAGHALEKELRHQEPEHQFERQCDGRDEQRVQDATPRAGLLEELGVVGEPGEGRVGLHHRDAHEAHHERVDQRKKADRGAAGRSPAR